MRTTIDRAGRVVIPKGLRDSLGLGPGPVELEIDGAGLRVSPVAGAEAEEKEGFLVVPASGVALDDDLVRGLRDADQK